MRQSDPALASEAAERLLLGQIKRVYLPGLVLRRQAEVALLCRRAPE